MRKKSLTRKQKDRVAFEEWKTKEKDLKMRIDHTKARLGAGFYSEGEAL
ncbi:MAG TPA: hypothetical protein VMV86_04395 [Methanosarcinales archaeon]|nr:hypothetical protein [Methanosarcinales archaeon]